jgi:KDO2-lipid IV(A) lauroyltransferase
MTLRSRMRPVRRAAVYAMVVALTALARLMPRRMGLTLFGLAGGAAFFLHAASRSTTLGNIAHAFGGRYSLGGRWLMGIRTFANFGKAAFDAIRIPFTANERILQLATIEGEEKLKSGLAEGKGIVVPTGHIGNWEFLAAYLSAKGYPISVVAKKLKDPRLDALLIRVRESKGVETIDKDSGAHRILRALNRGRVLGVLMDQDTRVKGTFADFMGRKAFTPTAAAELAVRTKAPLIPMAMVMKEGGMYRARIGDPLKVQEGLGDQEKITELTRLCNSYLEKEILEHPTQWVWMHERWKSSDV